MKHLFPVLTILIVAGCDGARQSDGNEAAAAKPAEVPAKAPASSAPIVTNFKMAKLAGLSVRDHPEGVQVVTPPTARGDTPPPPGTNDIVWGFGKGTIFTSVNGTTARDAKHFRELMDAVGPEDEVKLGYKLFFEDAGDGWTRIVATPSDD